MIPRWLFWTLLALFSWGVWAILSKVIGDALSPAHSQSISTLGLLPVIGTLALIREPPTPGLARRGILWAVLAGVLSCLGNIPYYRALSSGAQAATVVPLTALYPLVTVLLAVMFLNERLNRVQSAGITVSLLAMYLFNMRDERGLLSLWLFGALAALVLWGVSGFLQKLSTQNVSGSRSAFWFLLAFVPVGAVILVQNPLPAAITLRTWCLAVALGFMLGFGNLAVIVAFAQGGKASIIMPLAGLYPLISVPIAMVALSERVGWREWLGLGLAVSAVAMLCYESPAAELAEGPS